MQKYMYAILITLLYAIVLALGYFKNKAQLENQTPKQIISKILFSREKKCLRPASRSRLTGTALTASRGICFGSIVQLQDLYEEELLKSISEVMPSCLQCFELDGMSRSLKRYFLMEQGDFIVQLLDLCEEELVKPISEVMPSRLQCLFELALRTSTGKHDPYKEDITLTILTQNNTYQILSIQRIGNESS